jgi:aminoacylase
MKENSVRPKRSIHLTFVPDEEIGGLTGLAPFLDTPEFKVKKH